MRNTLIALMALTTSALAQPVSLFDGKTLDGWDFDPKLWKLEEGEIRGGSLTEKVTHNDFIATKKHYSNFDLRVKLRLSGTGFVNSGVQIRSLRVPGTPEMCGFQVDYGKGWYGKIYDEGRRNKVVAEAADLKAADAAIKEGEWNEYRIRAEGPRIQSWINGVPALDYTETDPNIPQDGIIGIQIHGGGAAQVQVKDIVIEELPATPNAPTWEKLGGVEGVRKLVAPPKKQADAAKPGKRDISYNNVQGTALTAEEELKKFHLPEGYEIELVAKESEGIGKFVSVYFDQRGRMWTQTALEYPVDANENPAAAEAVYANKGKDKVLVYPREALNATLPAGGLTHPTVFADGLAIPLGILPWGNGDTCYIQHGHDLKLFKDTNGDGKADTFDVVLTGFGVQDSHLFPHQFTRAPGGWIWMAQGLFNNSKVHKPGSDVTVDYPKCGMARFRPDGSEFEMTSIGPNNIWGLVVTSEGETFIQEANDYGFPVMPFHEYAYYPGGMEALKKSYQPDFPPQAEFRMGGTGLSGLALIESGPLVVRASARSGGIEERAKARTTNDLTMAVANPIISKIQTIAMHRDGAYWKLTQLPDLITCDDPFFRPVALTNGPDGCIYIVDWYNKIISHNEVPRAHPDRDKTRGRIWRVKAKGQPIAEIPDMSAMPTENMLDYLESPSTWAQDVASQILADRKAVDVIPTLKTLVNDDNKNAATRIHALWTWEQLGSADTKPLALMLKDKNPAIRREAARAMGSFSNDLGAENVAYFLKPLVNDPDADVRRAGINTLGNIKQPTGSIIDLLISFAKLSLPGPTTLSSRAPKQIPVREAYDREFERFLVRMFLERHPDVVAKFLDSDAAAKLPVEARVLASLALEPKSSAARVAKLLPQLDRAPNDEELLRLAQFPTEPGVSDALKALLTNEKSRAAVAEKLLVQRTKLDAAQIAPMLADTAKQLLSSAPELALQLIGGFQLASLEKDLVALVSPMHDTIIVSNENRSGIKSIATGSYAVSVIHALRDLRSGEADLFATIAKSDPDPLARDAALEALAASRAADAGTKLLELYPSLQPAQRSKALNTISITKVGAKTIVTALLDKKLPQADLDGPTVERLATVLGDDPALQKLQQQLGGIFREVMLFDGQETAWTDSKITLDGPFTVETWVRLAPNIGNDDDILGAPGGPEMNFFQSKFRVFAGPQLHDVCVSTKPMTPDLWTHIAVTRDAKGIIRIYQNGELDATGNKPAPAKWENCRIGWSGPRGGTEGVMTEFRVWSRERTAAEIRTNFDRVIASAEGMKRYDQAAGKPGKGVRIAKTIDTPPLLTEEQAKALDTKFAKFSALAPKGNAANGKMMSALCMACHQIGNAGGQIGPNLSGAGAMGLEAVLRNILTPNAAMEPGYRIYRVEMNNGDLIDAFFVSEDKTATIIRQPGVPDRRLDKKDIGSTKFIRRSLMPEGLLDALPEQSVADLLAYLMTLKG